MHQLEYYMVVDIFMILNIYFQD